MASEYLDQLWANNQDIEEIDLEMQQITELDPLLPLIARFKNATKVTTSSHHFSSPSPRTSL